MSVEGKVAIVTGAANGLGRAVARQLAERGASVILTDVDIEAGQSAADEIGANVRFVPLDVWDEAQWLVAIAAAKETFGGYDILVNNAAIPALISIEKATRDEWLRVFQTNAGGVFLGCKHAIRSMRESKKGSIVNVSSNSSVSGMWNCPVYASSKGAINALTKSIVSHCRHEKLAIRCNTVIPGGMRSKMARGAMLDMMGVDIESGSPEAEQVLAAVGLVPPDQVAEAVVFLASDASERINGAEVLVDGGESTVFPLG